MDKRTVEREMRLASSPEEVWAALTEGSRLSSWFGADVELDARPGGKAVFRWPDGSETRALVESADPPHRFVFRWLPWARGADGGLRVRRSTRVEFLIEEVDGGTLLRVGEAPADPAAGSRTLRARAGVGR